MKKIKLFRLLALFMVLIASINNVWAGTKRVYIDVSWNTNYNNVWVHWWDNDSHNGDVQASLFSSGTWNYMYYADIDDRATGWQVKRKGGDGNWCNLQNDVTYSSANFYKVNDWNYNGTSKQIPGLVTGGYVYMNNTTSAWNDASYGYRYFAIGNTTTKLYQLSKLSGTNLWACTLSDTWPDASYYSTIGSASSWSGGSWGYSNLKNASKYLEEFTGTYDFTSGQTYLLEPGSSSNGASMTFTYQDGGYSALNRNQTLHIMLSSDRSSYSDVTSTAASWKGTIKATYTKITGDKTATTYSSGTAETLSSSAYTKGAAITSNYQLDESSTTDGYTFIGFNTSNSAPSPSNTSITINNISGANDIYAFFMANSYNVNLDYDETGLGTNGQKTSVTAIYDAAMPSMGTAPVGATGYKFQGYFTEQNGGGTKYYNADGSSAKVWDIDDDKTLYAYFKKVEIAELELSATTVHPWVEDETMDSITVTPTLSIIPEGTVKICYEIQYSDGSSVTDDGLQTFRDMGSNSIRFRAPKASGSYRVHAELKTNNCSGTVLDTENALFIVTGPHKVTVKYLCEGNAIRDDQVLSINALDSVSVTAPTDIFGYTFSEWDMTAGITSNTGSTVNPKKFVADYDGTITVKYVETPIVYFYNNLGWTDVYVTYDSYWDGSTKEASDAGRPDGAGIGSGNWGKTYHHMTNITGTDIWYDQVPEYYTNNGFEHWAWNITFNDTKLGTLDFNTTGHYMHFNTGKAVIRYDFDPQNTMFVPASEASTFVTNGVTYESSTSMYHNDEKLQVHNCGYWKKYNSTSSGYSLRGTFAGIVGDESEWDGTNHNLVAESADANIFSTTLKLYNNRDYSFRIYRNNKYLKLDKASGFTNQGLTINQNTNREDNAFRTDVTWVYSGEVTLHTSTEGEYTFYVNFTDEGTMLVTIDFPDDAGDYQVLYKDDVHTNWHPAGVINADATENTTSFFVRKDQTPVIKWRKSTAVANDGTITWGALQNVDLSSYQGSGKILDNSSNKYGVYNFNFTIANNTLSLADVEEYTGQYYIRTNSTNKWKWEHYTDADHLMTYSDYAAANSGYSHYFMKYILSGKNVKFVVANDYSPCISDTLTRESTSGTWANIATYMDEGGDLKRSANVRFMWDKATNNVSRAYVDGAQDDGSAFLQLLSDDSKIKQGETTKTAVTFDDNGNWIYEADIKAQPGAQIKLKSTWGTGGTAIVQYFKGSADATAELVGGSGSDFYDFRLVYDYKTNRLVTSYIPSGNITAQLEINADVMFIREHQEDIEQLTFSKADESSPMGSISKINTAYGVMRFNKWTLNNKDKSTHTALPSPKSNYERDLFYISFPFRVNLEEVFGFGTYGTHWIIEEYDGAGRAEKGFWADSPSFWTFVTNRSGKFLEPNTGYILALDLDQLGESSSVWENTDQVELYFPSTGSISSITSSSVTYNIPEHKCNIGPRFLGGDDRRVKDSHWNVLSVPTYVNTNNTSFANTDWITTADKENVGPSFLYVWNSNDNSLTPTAGRTYTYKAMHAYMVQYCGNITWTTSVTPSSVAARLADIPDRDFKLVLQSEEQTEDQTYIRLTDNQNVTTGFEFNYDLCKEMNKNRANIYTLISTTIDSVSSITEAAANVQPHPLSTTIVPVGVKIATASEYTFSMPEGTNGGDVWLLDNQTGSRTNLGLMDYTVNLTTGTIDGRFSLEFPVQNVVTELENDGLNRADALNDVNDGVRKVFVGGRLYIIRDGKAYDATGAQVK